MRKTFITGLVILLPLALTFAVVHFLFNLLTVPFIGVFQQILHSLGITNLFGSAQLEKIFVQLVILVMLFFFTVLLGVFTRWFFLHTLIRIGDKIFHSIPFIRTIYKTTQDVIHTLFSTESRAFKQAVLVHFPNKDTYSIGLVTNEKFPKIVDDAPDLVAVFVPTTPNPTSGFLMLFKREDITYLDIKVESALKYIISCGMISTPFTTAPSQPESTTE